MRPEEFKLDDEEPIKLEPDDPNEIHDDQTIFRRKGRSFQEFAAPKPQPKPDSTDQADGQSPHSTKHGEALQWALDVLHEPAMAAADWLARDIDPSQPSAVALLTNPDITLAQIRQAKSVF